MGWIRPKNHFMLPLVLKRHPLFQALRTAEEGLQQVIMQMKLITGKSVNKGLENWTRPLAGIKPEINKQKKRLTQKSSLVLEKIVKVTVSREFLIRQFSIPFNSFSSALNDYVFVISNVVKKSQKLFCITRNKCSLPVTMTLGQLIAGINNSGVKCL